MQGLGQFPRGAGELAQHQHAAFIVARRDEFLRDEVHPVVEAADVAEVRPAVEAEHFRRLVVLVPEDKRPPPRALEPLVDALDQARDAFPEIADTPGIADRLGAASCTKVSRPGSDGSRSSSRSTARSRSSTPFV